MTTMLFTGLFGSQKYVNDSVLDSSTRPLGQCSTYLCSGPGRGFVVWSLSLWLYGVLTTIYMDGPEPEEQ